MNRILLNIPIPFNWMQNSSHTPVWATVWWNIDDYLALVIIYLKHQSLRMVNSLKITSFRVCNFALLSFTDKEFPPFSDPYSSSTKSNSGLCEAAELYGRNCHHEGAAFANVLQITENQFKGMLSTSSWYTACGERILPFLFTC